MSTEMAKAFDAKEAQRKCLQLWVDGNYFHSEPDPAKKPFSIVIPPPNVTGALHLGHALNNTLQDVLSRWRRMQGYNVLWMPGTDHAGIATQAVVERLIFNMEKKTRHDLGREELVNRIWQWKEKYEARILGQLRELGASCDWQRTRFTLDPICARAVRETFFRMFRDGYIYRGKRLVNWDTQLQTSVADDETYTENTKGGFWTFRYPVKGQPDISISFSTTRPETMIGDCALCVHPSDERYKALIGKTVTIPFNGREIPIIADGLLADPELGTGCVKVTPAHDPNDYACWQRHPEIEIINILNSDGTINDQGGEFAGLDRYKAREAIVNKMKELDYYVSHEDRIIPLKYSDRSKSPIEPYLSDQWFVKMSDRDDGKIGLAQMAIDAVEKGKVKFYPDRYAKMYLDWLGEKRDWCVSRQLWWGHRISIWYTTAPESAINQAFSGRSDVCWKRAGESDTFLICATEDLAADAIPGHTLTQETDVLDTWFSSALWPHSTLGWPEATPELKYYYPTSSLVTSRDIITLWVARMVLTGLYNMGDIPFHHVYVHPKMLDGFGETMSKTKGNGIDPLDIIDLYGTDALRYGMVNVATETQDSRMPVVNVCPHCGDQVAVKQEHMCMRTKKLNCPKCKQAFRPGGPWPADDPELLTARQASDRFEIGRNFANKLWNATRFILMNMEGYTPGPINMAQLPPEDTWILSRLSTTVAAVTKALEEYRFAESARLIYDFSWSEFCDWYIEIAKSRLADDDKVEVQRIFIAILDVILRLAHPIMPFVTESLWQALNSVSPKRGFPVPEQATASICIAPWPTIPEGFQHPQMETCFARMQELIRGIREIRNRYQIDGRTPLKLHVKASQIVSNQFLMLAQFIGPLAGLANFELGPEVVKPKQSATMINPEFEMYIPLEGLIDPAVESKRLEKQIADAKKQLLGITSKLNNESYVKNAPPEVVTESRSKAAELETQIRVMEENLQELR
jgi:valyl-tRNA synthetase